MKHDNLIELTIEKLSYPLIKFMKTFQRREEVAKSSERLFESIVSHSEKIFLSLG